MGATERGLICYTMVPGPLRQGFRNLSSLLTPQKHDEFAEVEQNYLGTSRNSQVRQPSRSFMPLLEPREYPEMTCQIQVGITALATRSEGEPS